VKGTDIIRFSGDRFAEVWTSWDELVFMQQLGMELKPSE
jgi:hypothetical protein